MLAYSWRMVELASVDDASPSVELASVDEALPLASAVELALCVPVTELVGNGELKI